MTSAARSDLALWAVAWVLLAMNLYYSFGPPPPGATAFEGADKVLHAGAYAVTVGAFLLAAVWRPGQIARRIPAAEAAIIGVAVALSVASEVLQGTVFARDADPLDAIADLVGAALAYLVWRVAVMRSGVGRA